MGLVYFWHHLRVSFSHKTSIKSERLQNLSSFFLLLWATIIKKGYSVQSSAIFWVTFSCYNQKQYMNQAFCEKRKLSHSVCASFARKWKAEMMSQSKLNPFSCIVVPGPKKCPTTLIWKGTTSEGIIQGQKLLHQSIQGSSESLFMWKGLTHFNDHNVK